MGVVEFFVIVVMMILVYCFFLHVEGCTDVAVVVKLTVARGSHTIFKRNFFHIAGGRVGSIWRPFDGNFAASFE